MRRLAVLLGAAALASLSVIPAAHAADPQGVVTGQLTDALGSPLSGAYVSVESHDAAYTYSPTEVASGQTRDDGTFSVTAPPGTYIVQVSPDQDHQSLARHWVGGDDRPRTGAAVTVTDGGTTSVGVVALPASGAISGTVYDTSGHTDANGCAGLVDDPSSSFEQMLRFRVNADGTYRYAGLYPRPRYMGFNSCSKSGYAQYWDHATTPEQATPISVPSGGERGGIDAVVDDGASVSGTVTDTHGNPVASGHACLNLYDLQGNRVQSGGGPPSTAGPGAFTAIGLPEGQFKLQVYVCSDDEAKTLNLLPVWWGGTNYATAATVTVSKANPVTGIDVSLPDGGQISGTVTDGQGHPVTGACVWDAFSSLYDITAADGTYLLGPLPTVSTEVSVADCGNTSGHAPTWWPHLSRKPAGTPIGVTQGQRTTGIDLALDLPEAVITGRLIDHAGHPIAHGCISASYADGQVEPVLTSSYGDDDGTFAVHGLGPSSAVRLEVGQCGTSQYETRYGVGPYVTQLGATTAAGDLTLDEDGSISGTLVDERGIGPLGVRVSASCQRASGSGAGASTITDSSGHYSLRGLPPGTCTLDFSDSARVLAFQSWYGYPGPHVAVPVVAGQDTPLPPQLVLTQSTPGAPLDVTGVVGDATGQLVWSPPTSDGHSSITGYQVLDAKGHVVAATRSGQRSTKLAGLVDGHHYAYSVVAVNAKGVGAASHAVTITPRKGAVLPRQGLQVTRSAHGLSLLDLQGKAGGRVRLQVRTGPTWKTVKTLTERHAGSCTWTVGVPRGASSVRLVRIDAKGKVTRASAAVRPV